MFNYNQDHQECVSYREWIFSEDLMTVSLLDYEISYMGAIKNFRIYPVGKINIKNKCCVSLTRVTLSCSGVLDRLIKQPPDNYP